EAKIAIQKMDQDFSEENNNLNLNLATWEGVRVVDFKLFLQEGVIDDASNLFEYQKAMEFRCQ
ncbi:hypothetical protein KI387_044422, partial [Taxus chinensis]